MRSKIDFFMEKDKAKAPTIHLMISDHRRPRPRATPDLALPAFKVVLDALFEGT